MLSNRIRREVIILLASEGPLTYSELMKKVGIEDSGTFGFHMRKMHRLLKKNDMGEYELSELGLKAYDMLKGSSRKEEFIKVERPNNYHHRTNRYK